MCDVCVCVCVSFIFLVVDIEAAIKELQSGRKGHHADNGENDENKADRIGLGAAGHFDQDIYSSSKISALSGQYVDSIAPNDEQDVSCVMVFNRLFIDYLVHKPAKGVF